MEAGPQTGLEGPRYRGPPDRGRELGHGAVTHYAKTCDVRMNGSKTVLTRTPWPTRRSSRDTDWRSQPHRPRLALATAPVGRTRTWPGWPGPNPGPAETRTDRLTRTARPLTLGGLGEESIAPLG